MSRSYLVLTTIPPATTGDPSEREAVLAARRDEALEARGPDAPGTPPRRTGHPLVLGFVDRLGRTHVWPGLLRFRHSR
jgi:hypothetical protein